jgi:membrane protein YqaA with SNARE-associated domain
MSTTLIVLGVILCTASGSTDSNFMGFVWFFTIARGMTVSPEIELRENSC